MKDEILESRVRAQNASNAINVLLSMWKFKDNEVLLDFTTAYGNFQSYYRWLAATRGVETVTVPIKFPLTGPQPILDALKQTLADLKASGKKASSPRAKKDKVGKGGKGGKSLKSPKSPESAPLATVPEEA